MWGGWLDALARRLEGEVSLSLRDGLYPLLGVDRETGVVHAHGLLAATPMSRIRAVVQAYVAESGANPDEAAAAVEAAWHAPDPVALAQPVTDLGALLGRLRPRVGTFAVATSDDRVPTERTLVALGVADAFAAITCADDGIRTKPAPDPVLHLCSMLGIPPERTVVVGDSPADLLMGRSAGAARSIGVLTGVGDRASLAPYADLVLASIAELAPA